MLTLISIKYSGMSKSDFDDSPLNPIPYSLNSGILSDIRIGEVHRYNSLNIRCNIKNSFFMYECALQYTFLSQYTMVT